ncbi:MAG: hypothetical protein ACLRXQ_10500 [Phascolarctobacterium faecium]
MDFQEMFFSFDGRLNRKPYILRFLLRNAIIWCLGYLIGSLLRQTERCSRYWPLL